MMGDNRNLYEDLRLIEATKKIGEGAKLQAEVVKGLLDIATKHYDHLENLDAKTGVTFVVAFIALAGMLIHLVECHAR
jgi:hypothetical protein